MAGRLIPITIPAPGIRGLNLQETSAALGPEWCRTALNCVIDSTGRLAARKGWTKSHTTAITSTPDVEQVFEYKPDSGTNVDIAACDNKIYKDRTSPTDITGSVSITANNWKFQNFSGNMVGFQASHEPMWWDGSGNIEYLVDQHTQWAATTAYAVNDIVIPTTRNGYYYQCTTAGTSGGTEPTWSTTLGGTTADGTVTWTTREIPKGNEVLSAWGRTWVASADGKTIHYSDLLIPQSYHGGSSGSIDLQSVWTLGQDTIVALAAFNNNLVIFGKDTVTVYANADDPFNIVLSEVIYDMGCIARDSVQYVDEDIFFLSKTGVRSLKRTILQNKMPQTDVTKNVRDDVIQKISFETVTKIRSAYSKPDGLYLISFPTSSIVYAIDIKKYVSEQVVRVFQWDILPLSMHVNEDDTLVMGFTGGWIGTYTGTSDNGSQYNFEFSAAWTELSSYLNESSIAARLIILKKYEAILIATANITPALSWAFNFSNSSETQSLTLAATGLAEYNTGVLAEYGIAEWSGGATSHTFSVNTSGSGRTFSFGITVPINGSTLSYQFANLMFKLGRIT